MLVLATWQCLLGCLRNPRPQKNIGYRTSLLRSGTVGWYHNYLGLGIMTKRGRNVTIADFVFICSLSIFKIHLLYIIYMFSSKQLFINFFFQTVFFSAKQGITTRVLCLSIYLKMWLSKNVLVFDVCHGYLFLKNRNNCFSIVSRTVLFLKKCTKGGSCGITWCAGGNL